MSIDHSQLIEKRLEPLQGLPMNRPTYEQMAARVFRLTLSEKTLKIFRIRYEKEVYRGWYELAARYRDACIYLRRRITRDCFRCKGSGQYATRDFVRIKCSCVIRNA